MTHEERKERRRTLATQVASGRTVRQVARDNGVSQTMVRYAMEQFGVANPGYAKDIAASTYAIVGVLCNSTDSLHDVAKKFGVSPQRICQIYQRCQDASVPVKPRLVGKRSD